jgi:hypothetical protein
MITSIPLDLAISRIATLHRHDHRGRMIEVNQWDGGKPARFCLMRTADDVICRFRADVPDNLVRTLEELSSQEPRGRDLGKLPVHLLRYRTLLSSHAPVEAVSQICCVAGSKTGSRMCRTADPSWRWSRMSVRLQFAPACAFPVRFIARAWRRGRSIASAATRLTRRPGGDVRCGRWGRGLFTVRHGITSPRSGWRSGWV